MDVKNHKAYVSTGHLPPQQEIEELVEEAHERFKSNKDGKNSQVYPALARVPSELFGICVVGTSGNVYAVGDADYEFTIMSVSKPFIFALVCQELGVEEARAEDRRERHRAGIQLARRHRARPRRADEPDGELRGDRHDQPGAGRHLRGQVEVHPRRACRGSPAGRCRSTRRSMPRRRQTNFRNQSIARMLQSYGRIYMDPAEAVDLYTKQCALNCQRQGSGGDGRHAGRRRGQSDHQGARGGRQSVCHYALAVMATAGLYETSGDWLYDIGLPGKSGIGGGIVTVSPGKGRPGDVRRRRSTPPETASRGSSSPSSCRRSLGMDLFVSQPRSDLAHSSSQPTQRPMSQIPPSNRTRTKRRNPGCR